MLELDLSLALTIWTVLYFWINSSIYSLYYLTSDLSYLFSSLKLFSVSFCLKYSFWNWESNWILVLGRICDELLCNSWSSSWFWSMSSLAVMSASSFIRILLWSLSFTRMVSFTVVLFKRTVSTYFLRPSFSIMSCSIMPLSLLIWTSKPKF